MSVFIGSSEIADCLVGSTEVQEIYVGSNLVWQRLPDISAGDWVLTENNEGGLGGFLTDPTQTTSIITLYHGFYLSGSFILVTQKAEKAITLDAGTYRINYFLRDEISHPDGNRSQLTIGAYGTGVSGSTTLTDGSTLSAGPKTLDFTVASDGTSVTLRFQTGMNTSGASSTDDRRIGIQSISLEKL